MSFLIEISLSSGAAIIAGTIASIAIDAIRSKETREALKSYFLRRKQLANDEWHLAVMARKIDEAKNAAHAKRKFELRKAISKADLFAVVWRLMDFRLAAFVNVSLFSAMLTLNQIKQTAVEQKSTTVVEMMLARKIENSFRAQIVILTGLLIHILLAAVSVVNLSGLLVLMLALFFCAIHIDHKLIEHRVKKGWYGSNDFESREIIGFILSHADKDDFNDAGGLKRVVPLPEVVTASRISDSFGGARV